MRFIFDGVPVPGATGSLAAIACSCGGLGADGGGVGREAAKILFRFRFDGVPVGLAIDRVDLENPVRLFALLDVFFGGILGGGGVTALFDDEAVGAWNAGTLPVVVVVVGLTATPLAGAVVVVVVVGSLGLALIGGKAAKSSGVSLNPSLCLSGFDVYSFDRNSCA